MRFPGIFKLVFLPVWIGAAAPGRLIKIAVVDDGFRLSHQDLRDFWWINPGEIPGNGVDDDGNGYADDVTGWDVSDNDNDVTPPVDRLKDFPHGTYNAGIIAQMVKSAAGSESSIRIIPVKCLSDQATKTHLQDAYQGFEYALRIGADIISCAWGGGNFSPAEKALLDEAKNRGILVVASAGNGSAELSQYPAAYAGVIAVAALDSLDRKLPSSNYGDFITVAAPGALRGPGVFSDTAYGEYEGTSAAVPQIAALAALKKRNSPGLSPPAIRWLLQNSADPVDSLNAQYAGKLGAGKANAAEFLRADFSRRSHPGMTALKNPEGAILFRKPAGRAKSRRGKKSGEKYAWTIQPEGQFPGMRFKLRADKRDRSLLKLKGSAPGAKEQTYAFKTMPESLFVAGNPVTVQFLPEKPGREYRWELEYRAVTLDSSGLYCRETKFLDLPGGSFQDGSGRHDYAGNSDCKWLITAPAGKTVELKFSSFDTEARKDWVYVFDGTGTHEHIVGALSGPNIPPPVYSSGNTMLVWFVTDGRNQGAGWEAHYGFREP